MIDNIIIGGVSAALMAVYIRAVGVAWAPDRAFKRIKKGE